MDSDKAWGVAVEGEEAVGKSEVEQFGHRQLERMDSLVRRLHF